MLLFGALVMVAPFIWMVATSLKPKAEIFSSEFHLLPQNWGAAENYATALTQVPLLHFLLNGVIVTVSIFALQVLVNVPAAYALAKLRFRGRDTMFGAVLLCLLIPYQAVALPIYILFFGVGLLNTYASLILPIHHLGVRHIPDAAILHDGAGRPDRCGAHRRHERIRHCLGW